MLTGMDNAQPIDRQTLARFAPSSATNGGGKPRQHGPTPSLQRPATHHDENQLQLVVDSPPRTLPPPSPPSDRARGTIHCGAW